jgi:hypothetical protein
MIASKIRSTDGMALVIVLSLMLMALIIGLTAILTSVAEIDIAGNEMRSSRAFYAAEASLEVAKQVVSDSVHIARDTTRNSELQYLIDSRIYEAQNDSAFANSQLGARIVPMAYPMFKEVYGWGVPSASENLRTVSVVVQIRKERESVWDNAIYAGSGESGRAINGNVDIRGGVHCLGNGEVFTDLDGDGHRNPGEQAWEDLDFDGIFGEPAEPYSDRNANGLYDAPLSGELYQDINGNDQWDAGEPYMDSDENGAYTSPSDAVALGGTSMMGNNYEAFGGNPGMPASLLSRVPALEFTYFGGEFVQSIEAKLRVRAGNVTLSGSGQVGWANHLGDNIKETIDRIYTNGDLYGGSYFADNYFGSNPEPYESDLEFPSLENPFTDPESGTYYATYEQYLNANSQEISGGVTEISENTPSFSYIVGSDTMAWDQSTGTLHITGIWRTTPGSDLDIGKKSTVVHYTGHGTLFAKQDIRLHGSVITAPGVGFPRTETGGATMGFIAKRDMYIATGPGEAQLELMGAYFAERRITSAKQNKIAGTFVSNYFDLGTNVPSIYQVPELANNLPPGMPGADVNIIWIANELPGTWHEVSGRDVLTGGP